MLLLYVNNSPRSNQDTGWTCLCDLGYLQQAHSPNYTDSNKQRVGCKREVVQGEGIGLNPTTSLRAPNVIKVVFYSHHACRVKVAILMYPILNCWSSDRHVCLLYEQLFIEVELCHYYTYYSLWGWGESRFGNNMLTDFSLKYDRKAMRLEDRCECHNLIVGGLMCRWAEPWLTSSKHCVKV